MSEENFPAGSVPVTVAARVYGKADLTACSTLGGPLVLPVRRALRLALPMIRARRPLP